MLRAADAKNPIGFFVHPLPALAVALLLVNDHILKGRFPSALTGKISDFAGLFFFPLFLLALFFWLRHVWGHEMHLTRGKLLTTMFFTYALFAAIKLVPSAAGLYESVHSSLGVRSQVILDATDLIAFLVAPFTYWHARRFF